jgi:ribosomal-protein-alanine N-acetyltransferase
LLSPPVILATSRIDLTELVPSDAPELFALNGDPEVVRYVGDGPFASVEAAGAFLAAYRDYRAYGYGRWAMRRREDGAFLGWCGLKYHPDTCETDLGYRLHRRYWGQGYATEAGQACLDYGFGKLGLARIVAHVVADNTASSRVLEKCGMSPVASISLEGRPGLVYSIDRPRSRPGF